MGAVDCTQEKGTCSEFGVQGCAGSRGRGVGGAGAEGRDGQAGRAGAATAGWSDTCPSNHPLHPHSPPHLLGSFPTLKFFGSNKDQPEDYNGGRDSGSLAAFATQRWSAQQPPPEVGAGRGCRGGGWGCRAVLPRTRRGGASCPCMTGLSTARPTPAPAPQVRELVDEQTWEEHCVGHAADASLDLPEIKPKQL